MGRAEDKYNGSNRNRDSSKIEKNEIDRWENDQMSETVKRHKREK